MDPMNQLAFGGMTASEGFLGRPGIYIGQRALIYWLGLSADWDCITKLIVGGIGDIGGEFIFRWQ